jgi:hypothetical protein
VIFRAPRCARIKPSSHDRYRPGRSEEELFQRRWSPAILDEVRRHVPVSPEAIDRRIACSNAAFEDAPVTATNR